MTFNLSELAFAEWVIEHIDDVDIDSEIITQTCPMTEHRDEIALLKEVK